MLPSKLSLISKPKHLESIKFQLIESHVKISVKENKICENKTALLFDVTEQGHTPHDPMSGSNVALKVNGSNVVDIRPGGLPVYGALVQPTVLS